MNNSNNNERMWASSHSSELLLSSLPDATLRTQSFSLDSPAEARPPMQQPPLSPEWRPLSQGFATVPHDVPRVLGSDGSKVVPKTSPW